MSGHKLSGNTQNQLKSLDAGERQLAVKKLARSASADARKAIIERLRVEDVPEVLEWLLIGVRNLHAYESSPQVIELLQHQVGDVRRFACEAMGVIADDKSLPCLGVAAQKDQDYQVRLAAIQALQKTGSTVLENAPGALRELEQARDFLFAQESVALHDLARAATLAAAAIEKSQNKKLTGSLFEDGGELLGHVLVVGGQKKNKNIQLLEDYLKRLGAQPSEIRYAVSVTRSIVRNSRVVRRRKAEGVQSCQLCDRKFFLNKSGKLYCQVAHIKGLHEGGRDSLDNTLLLCANCHAQLDMAQGDTMTKTHEVLHIRLPDGTEQRFILKDGQPPQRLDKS